MKSKKLLVNRSELVDLSATLKIMKTEMDRNNRELSQRLGIIENHVNKLRKRPKPTQVSLNASLAYQRFLISVGHKEINASPQSNKL